MSMSGTSGGSRYPGLTLLAWALVSNAGALIKGSNVSAAAVGFTLTFTANLPHSNYVADISCVTQNTTAGGVAVNFSARSVGSCSYSVATSAGSIATDHYIAIYG